MARSKKKSNQSNQKQAVESVDRKQKIKVEGVVSEALPNTMFRVELSDGRQVTCHLAGKMRIHYIKVMPGDKVDVEMTPYDDKRGRIIYRYK